MSETSRIFSVQPASVSGIKTFDKMEQDQDNMKHISKKAGLQKICKISYEEFKRITEKANSIAKINAIDIIYGPIALFILTSSSFSATLIPVHNVIISPEYWYEIIFSCLSAAFFIACCFTIGAEAVLGLFNHKRLFVIINLFATILVASNFGFILVHLVWSKMFGYFDPLPYQVQSAGNLSLLSLFFRFWYMAPKERRTEQNFRKRFKFFAFWYLWILFTSFQLSVVLVILGKIQSDSQWVIALLLPLKKEINGYIMNKFIIKAALSENLVEAKFMAKIANNLFYSVSFAIAVTSVTKTTEYLLLGVSFCTNMALCFKVIRYHKRISIVDSETEKMKSLKEDTATELLLNDSRMNLSELVEIMVPISFIGACFAGYYGPNKDVMGIIGCSLWHQKYVEDFFSFITPVIEMALLDSASLILAGGILWWSCNINLFHEYCCTVKKYWKHLAFHGGSFLSAVSSLAISH